MNNILDLNEYEKDVVRALRNYAKNANNKVIRDIAIDIFNDALKHFHYVYNYEQDYEETSK